MCSCTQAVSRQMPPWMGRAAINAHVNRCKCLVSQETQSKLRQRQPTKTISRWWWAKAIRVSSTTRWSPDTQTHWITPAVQKMQGKMALVNLQVAQQRSTSRPRCSTQRWTKAWTKYTRPDVNRVRIFEKSKRLSCLNLSEYSEIKLLFIYSNLIKNFIKTLS